MTRRGISQREARRLRKRVEELEQRERARLARYDTDYPGGVNVESFRLANVSFAKLDISQRLGFVLVAKCSGPDSLRIYAVKP